MTSSFKSRTFWSSIVLSLLSFAARGQQNPNLPLGALPMQYNGGFAGEAGSPRLSTNFSLLTGRGAYDRGYHLTASYDQFIPSIRSGIGVSAQTHQVSNSFYDYSGYTVSAAVAPKFSLRGKWTLSPSLDLEYLGGRSTVNDIRNLGFEGERWRGRAGLLVNTSKFYFGYSFVVMDRLSQRFSNGISKAGRPTGFNSYLQLGYTFQRSPESNFSFTPQLTWAIGTGDFPAFDYRQKAGINYFQAFSLNFRYKQFIWGVNNTGVHVGWQSSRVKVMASNGIGSAGDGSSGYAGNVSLRYMLKDNPTSTRW